MPLALPTVFVFSLPLLMRCRSQVVDRFGWHYTMTMRLGTYASRCGWYSYYVLILGPTQ